MIVIGIPSKTKWIAIVKLKPVTSIYAISTILDIKNIVSIWILMFFWNLMEYLNNNSKASTSTYPNTMNIIILIQDVKLEFIRVKYRL